MAGFDVEAARKAGYGDDEILQHLTATRKFDIDGAVKSGYSKSDIISHLSSTPPPASGSWIDSVSDFAKGAWNNLAETGQGMVDLVTTRPDKTIKGIGEAQDSIRLKAEEAFKKGDYATGVRHVLGYLAPMVGPGIDRAGDKAQEGKVAESLGEATSIGLQMAAPGALARSAPAIGAAADSASAAVKGASSKVAGLASAPGVPQMVSGGAEAVAGAGAAVAGHPVIGAIEIARGVNRFAKGAQLRKASIAERVNAAAKQASAPVDPAQFTGTAPLTPNSGPVSPGPVPVGTGMPFQEPSLTAAPGGSVSAPAVASLLDEVAVAQAGKPFAKLSPRDQAAIRSIAERISPQQVPAVAVPNPTAVPSNTPPPAVEVPAAPPQPAIVEAAPAPVAAAPQRIPGAPYRIPMPFRERPAVPEPAPAASVAEQLRDAMVPESGAAPGEVAVIAPEPVPTATAKALKPLMEQVPPATRKEMAKANYRDGARGQDAKAAYESGARQTKIEKLAQALHDNGITHEEAMNMGMDHWRMLSEATGQHLPSKVSIEETLHRLDRLERAANTQAKAARK